MMPTLWQWYVPLTCVGGCLFHDSVMLTAFLSLADSTFDSM